MLPFFAGGQAHAAHRQIKGTFQQGVAIGDDPQFKRKQHEQEKDGKHYHEFDTGRARFLAAHARDARFDKAYHWRKLNFLTEAAITSNTSSMVRAVPSIPDTLPSREAAKLFSDDDAQDERALALLPSASPISKAMV